MRKSDRGKEEIKELHICLAEGSSKPFFASLVSVDGLVANLRSSTPVEKTAMIHLAPVPHDWHGGTITPDQVMNHPNLQSGSVSRVSRGTFTLRLHTEEAQHMRKQIRDGSVGLDDLVVKMLDTGAVTTIQVTGGLGMASATKLQAALSKLGPNQQIALMDFTDMTVTSEAAVKFLMRFIHEFQDIGKIIGILARPNSRIMEILAGNDNENIIDVFTNREMAVATLIQQTLEG